MRSGQVWQNPWQPFGPLGKFLVKSSRSRGSDTEEGHYPQGLWDEAGALTHLTFSMSPPTIPFTLAMGAPSVHHKTHSSESQPRSSEHSGALGGNNYRVGSTMSPNPGPQSSQLFWDSGHGSDLCIPTSGCSCSLGWGLIPIF